MEKKEKTLSALRTDTKGSWSLQIKRARKTAVSSFGDTGTSNIMQQEEKQTPPKAATGIGAGCLMGITWHQGRGVKTFTQAGIKQIKSSSMPMYFA